MKAKILGLLIVLLAGPTTVGAAAVTWTLGGVTFHNGGTASGSFDIDDVTGDMLTWNITTTAGSSLPGFTYDTTNSDLFARDLWGFPNAYSISRTVPFADPYLNMTFASALTTAGTVNLITGGPLGGSWECEQNCQGLRRHVTAGYATTAPVPLPAAAWLLLSGLGGLGLLRKRKAA